MYINIILLVLLTIAAFVAGGVMIAIAHTDKQKWGLIGYPIILLGIGGTAWWIYSANHQAEVDQVDYFEIKTVIYPDDTQALMFTEDGIHKDATLMFHRVVDPKEFRVERVRWKKVYAGVGWGGAWQTGDVPSYSLVKKKK